MRLIHAEQFTFHSRKCCKFGLRFLHLADIANALPVSISETLSTMQQDATIVGNSTIIQGLICLEIKQDHVYMHIVENAPFNKGKNKMYSGVAGNLVAFACKVSFQRGFEGNVSFLSKSQLIEHYEKTLGAFHFGGRVMIIENRAALKLIDKYFK